MIQLTVLLSSIFLILWKHDQELAHLLEILLSLRNNPTNGGYGEQVTGIILENVIELEILNKTVWL